MNLPPYDSRQSGDAALRRRRRDGLDPWHDFERVQGQMGRLLEHVASSPGAVPSSAPEVVEEETGGSYVVKVRLPGVRSEDIVMELDGQDLHITADAYGSPMGGMRTRLRRRFAHHSALPRAVDGERARASFHEGVLTVRIPLTAEAAA
ncbi:Hsp20/alpha crystallin family protein [Streptomyces sp. NPDC046685]|uniref:Hsp20/alpha crystallin family protein n=1 Tax=Streptomyces sp. NPDC046685 TaxID=3157202 RepID=UPI0033E7BB99